MNMMENTWYEATGRFERYILAGDIGGTHTNLGLFGERSGMPALLYKAVFSTQEIEDFLLPLEQVMAEIRSRMPGALPTIACMSVAGPARNNYCKLTNAAWAVDGAAIERKTGFPCFVINDFMALSYAIPLLDVRDGEQIGVIRHTDGTLPEANGDVMAVVGAGTGLGTGFLIRHGERYRAYPSEGGHADFSAFDDESAALREFVAKKYPANPGTEPFLTGRGIHNIYEFYKANGMTVSGALSKVEAAAEAERPATISELAPTVPECRRVMRLFVRIYAKYAARAALTFLPSNGLYLAGGIVAKNGWLFTDDEDRFAAEFERSYLENIHGVLMGIPLFIVRDYASSLYGAANGARVLSLGAA